MASNPTTPNPVTVGNVTQIIGTLTGVVASIERIVGASGVDVPLEMAQIEQLTNLFGHLAGVAIQAAHNVAGKEVTPESVLALMPASTTLVEPQPVSPATP